MVEEKQGIATRAEGKLNSVWGVIKGLVAEDPLMALIGLFVVLPLAGLLIEGIRELDNLRVIMVIVVFGAIVVVVYIPLIIAKTWKKIQKDMKEERLEAIKERRTMEIGTWRASQERADNIIQAKIKHLQAQADFLFRQGDHWEKFLIHKAAEDLKNSVDERLGNEMSFISKAEFVDKYALFKDSLTELNQKYDNLITSFPKVMNEIEELGKGKIVTSPPEISISEKIDPEAFKPPEKPPETEELSQEGMELKILSYTSQIEAYAKEREENQAEIVDLLERNAELTKKVNGIEQALSPELATDVIIKSVPTSVEEEETHASEFDEALNVVDNLLDDTEDTPDEDSPHWDIEPMDKAPEPIHSDVSILPEKAEDQDTWNCTKCGIIFSSNAKRCSVCSISQHAARNLSQKK